MGDHTARRREACAVYTSAWHIANRRARGLTVLFQPEPRTPQAVHIQPNADGSITEVGRHSRPAVALYMHRNLTKIHQTLRVTSAMAADVSTYVWSVEELDALFGYAREPADAG
jgi:hypothetical protein